MSHHNSPTAAGLSSQKSPSLGPTHTDGCQNQAPAWWTGTHHPHQASCTEQHDAFHAREDKEHEKVQDTKDRDTLRDEARDKDRDETRDHERDENRDESRDESRDEERDHDRDEVRDQDRDEIRDEARDYYRDQFRDHDRDVDHDHNEEVKEEAAKILEKSLHDGQTEIEQRETFLEDWGRHRKKKAFDEGVDRVAN